MPQVASETINLAPSHTYRPARPGSAPAETPASAFENILDENARAAIDRPRSGGPAEHAAKDRPPAKSEAPKAARTDDTRSSDGGPADARSADAKDTNGKAADAKPADGKSDESGQAKVAAADPASPADAATTIETDAQGDGTAPTDASGKAETDADSTESKSGKKTDKPVTANPDIIGDGGDGGDNTKADAGDTGTPAIDLTGPKTGPAVAPTAPAAAHSENAAHAADAAEGRTPPVAAAALQAAANRPADAQAKGEEKKAATPGLPAQSKAEEAPGHSGQKPALPEHVDLPAQAHRNAPIDHAALPTPGHAHAASGAATDAGQPLAMTTSLQQQQPAQAPAAAPTPPQVAAQAAAVPLAGVAIEIAGRALAGKNRFEIRLDPPELGRIEVRLDVDRDGRVTSHLVVDRKDTLSLLQRDAASLQRALQDAGLKTADQGLQFSLRDQFAGHPQEQTDRGDTARLVVEDESLPALDAIAGTRFISRDGGVDIRV